MSTVILPRIESHIFTVRSMRVMIDADLAYLYGVPTKRLNEQVKRNRERFPSDFMFQLTPAEKTEVVANCDHLAKLKFQRHCLMRSPSMARFRRPMCWPQARR